jgi:hypothetical protein
MKTDNLEDGLDLPGIDDWEIGVMLPTERDVVFLGRNGYDCQVEEAKKLGLVPGAAYKAYGIQIHQSSSYVYLVGFEGKAFNTVMFSPLPTDFRKRCKLNV